MTVIPNAPPTVSLTSPTADFNAYAPATVTLSAKVDFYQGTTLIGTVANAPYTYAWAAATAGTYALTAVATDNLGAATTSLPVTITVTLPDSPHSKSHAPKWSGTIQGRICPGASASPPHA